jgi:hypothetical protein
MLDVRVGAGWEGPPTLANHRLYTTVVNRSRHDVPMPAVEIFQPSIGRGWPIHHDDPAEGMPDAIVARGSLLMTVPMSRFVGIDVTAPVVATTMTATGETYRSELSPLCWMRDDPPVVARFSQAELEAELGTLPDPTSEPSGGST